MIMLNGGQDAQELLASAKDNDKAAHQIKVMNLLLHEPEHIKKRLKEEDEQMIS